MKELIFHPLIPDLPFRHRGRQFYLRARGIDAIGLVREATMNPNGLLRLRKRIERVVRRPAPVALSHCLDSACDALQIRFVIWLLGQYESPYSIKSIAARADHPDPRVRSEVVRSLRRLRAWQALRVIELQHWDPATRKLAVPREPAPFEERLDSFAATRRQSCGHSDQDGAFASQAIDATSLNRHERPLVVMRGLNCDEGRPPRNPHLIARVLRRIRRLVRRPARHRSPVWTIGFGRCFGRSHSHAPHRSSD